MIMKDGKHLILCVDDDPDILQTLQLVLEANGYATVDAASADEGLKQYAAHRPDLVILDMMMEQIDSGSGLASRIRALGGNPLIYLLSSIGDSLAGNTDPTQLGFDGVFQKPINPKVLLATLKAQLQR